MSRRTLTWALEALVLDHLSVARVEASLGVAWDTANDAVLAEGQRTLIADATRFDGVQVLGVDDSPARFALKREVPPACGVIRGRVTSTSR